MPSALLPSRGHESPSVRPSRRNQTPAVKRPETLLHSASPPDASRTAISLPSSSTRNIGPNEGQRQHSQRRDRHPPIPPATAPQHQPQSARHDQPQSPG